MKHVPLFLLILFLISLTACSDNSSTPMPKPDALHLVYYGNYYLINKVIDSSNNGNLAGEVTLIKENRAETKIDWTEDISDETNSDGTFYDAYASIFRPDYSPLSAKIVTVNGIVLSPIHDGNTNGGYCAYGSIGFEIYSGKMANILRIESNEGFPDVLDSVFLPGEINITNLKKNDRLSRSSDLVLNWTGGSPESICEVSLIFNETYSDTTSKRPESLGLTKLAKNSGSFKITGSDIKASCDFNGKYNVQVTAYTPFYKRLSNGKDLLVIGVSSHKITVNIGD